MEFPNSLDTFVNPTPTSPSNNPSLSSQQSDQNDAIEALEVKVGIDGSADTDSLDYKLTNASSSNPGHKHTLANGATDVTASAAEVNTLDGFTGTYADLNYAKDLRATGVTSTEFDALDGINDGWTTFVPNWTNLTLGSGNVNTGAYKQIGKTVVGWVVTMLGTSPTVGAISLAAPVTPDSSISSSSFPAGTVVFEDSGSGYYYGTWIIAGALFAHVTSSSYASFIAISSSIPFTWAVNDTIRINFKYEAA